MHQAAVTHNAPPESLARHEEMKNEKPFTRKIDYAGELLPAANVRRLASALSQGRAYPLPAARTEYTRRFSSFVMGSELNSLESEGFSKDDNATKFAKTRNDHLPLHSVHRVAVWDLPLVGLLEIHLHGTGSPGSNRREGLR